MPSLPSLYLIADRATCAPRALEDLLREALNAGLRFIQIREKGLETDALRRLTESLLHLAEPFDATLFLNTRADLAAELGAHGVHLPASGASPAEIRQAFGTRLLIGSSVHNHTELDHVQGADFITFSPIYTPSAKPGHRGVGLPALSDIAQSTQLPVYALGGITPERVQACCESGANGIAVMSGILTAPNVEHAVKSYLTAWSRSQRRKPT